MSAEVYFGLHRSLSDESRSKIPDKSENEGSKCVQDASPKVMDTWLTLIGASMLARMFIFKTSAHMPKQ